jgi:hypothetical protein
MNMEVLLGRWAVIGRGVGFGIGGKVRPSVRPCADAVDHLSGACDMLEAQAAAA